MRNAVVFFDLGDTLVSGNSMIAGAAECLSTLDASGHRLGVISNTGDLTRQQLLALLPDAFSLDQFENDLVVLSSEHTFQKPELAIYQFALLQAGVAPGRCAFVGENLEEVIAAQVAGLHGIRIAAPESDFADLPSLVERYLAQ